MKTHTRGSTLVELLVVLGILGVVAGVTGLSFRPVARSIGPNAMDSRVANARRAALRVGKSVTVMLVRGESLVAATAHPDGRVVADSALAIDPLSGRRTP